MSNKDVENRIKTIRINTHLTQSEFAARLGVTIGVISNIELHRNKSDISKSPICNLICTTFNVNTDWLMTGKGDMFAAPSEGDPLVQLQQEYDLSDKAVNFIRNFLNLSETNQTELLRLLGALLVDPDV